MKRKLYLVLLSILVLVFFSGITYSFFNSEADLVSSDQGIAKFIFNSEKTNYIDMDLNGLLPGETKEISFNVSNVSSNKTSDVTVNYQITIMTYHFMPTVIELYKIENSNEILVGSCNETYGRNSNNELVCDMPIEQMNKETNKTDVYKLKVSFPVQYNDTIYSNIVDYVNLKIESWQKI